MLSGMRRISSRTIPQFSRRSVSLLAAREASGKALSAIAKNAENAFFICLPSSWAWRTHHKFSTRWAQLHRARKLILRYSELEVERRVRCEFWPDWSAGSIIAIIQAEQHA